MVNFHGINIESTFNIPGPVNIFGNNIERYGHLSEISVYHITVGAGTIHVGSHNGHICLSQLIAKNAITLNL